MVSDVNVSLVVGVRPRYYEELVRRCRAGTTLRDFLQMHAAPLQSLLGDAWGDSACSVWGQKRPPNYVLCDGDRIEITRSLRVDPKVARRERFQAQGKRRAGLFSKKPTPK
ncbi:RnfH family protein [Curvibacter sp. CHRR-16]|uniref:RnfH family protein n=1 Tax=Curvibacter sp. CHRR-16 TaxID=2835872 RepID=UPI001BD9A859|nr:RnfH family protein [Curvibacter sp. CHRR-16]MBT0570630.1 RnfH family protein [Curvibacter sp. CHRR-16]